uniref:Transposase Tc1-like domain-containing protein n=1 Tax=Acanthochromis polyacanthus TaxID=80966 RepID=A0A3Q1G9Q0_9TELE
VGKKKKLLNEQLKCRCSPSAVGYTLRKYRWTNRLEEKPRSGHPRVSQARNDRILIRMWRENCKLTSRELQSYKAVKKPLINERQKLAQISLVYCVGGYLHLCFCVLACS